MIDDGPVTVPTTEVVTDIGKVDQHLTALYRRTAGAEGVAVPVVRALLFNLVVYAASGADAEQAALDVSEVAGSHPCRAIVVDASPRQPDEPEAIVTAVCGITQRGDRRLCGEIVRIHLGEGQADVVGSVLPLLVADVPAYLWAPGDLPVGVAAFDDLLGVSDSILIDSRRFGDLAEGLRYVSGVCSARGMSCTAHDLCWTSLQLWMELTAQHFDPVVAREYLNKLTSILITYVPGEREDCPPSAALLLLAWLVERLDLKLASVRRESEGEFRIEATQDGRAVDVRLAPEPAKLEPGRVVAATIQGGDEHGTATFVTAGESMTQVSVTQECEGICFPPQVLELPSQSPAALAAQALDSFRRDAAYEAALVIALDMLRMMEGA